MKDSPVIPYDVPGRRGLKYNYTAVLPCHRTAMPPCRRSAVLPCCRVAVSPFCRVAVLPCHRTAMPPCHRVAVPPCCRVAVPPFTSHVHVSELPLTEIRRVGCSGCPRRPGGQGCGQGWSGLTVSYHGCHGVTRGGRI